MLFYRQKVRNSFDTAEKQQRFCIFGEKNVPVDENRSTGIKSVAIYYINMLQVIIITMCSSITLNFIISSLEKPQKTFDV